MFSHNKLRLFGAFLFAIAGLALGLFAGRAWSAATPVLWGLAGLVVGALMGVLAAPVLMRFLRSVPAPRLVAALTGLILGLGVAALLAFSLGNLTGWPHTYLPIVLSAVLGVAGVFLMVSREADFALLLPALDTASHFVAHSGKVVLDTSAIIDGRIADISQTGFIDATFIVPSFVLDELRHIADSGDATRRNRGRRGLEILNKLSKETDIPVQVLNVDRWEGMEVDGKLVMLAKSLNAPIVTTDYNLNRVAEIQGVTVLNVNELANALKSMVIPGEELQVKVIQEGKELGQGVAFLDDGTMIVVENGRRYVGSTVDVVVTRVLQTAAGRLIFTQVKQR